MERILGRVKEVFISKEYKNNMLIDVMDSKNIGFKVVTEKKEIEIKEEQDEFNAKIKKDDLVMITKQNVSGKDFVDIELYEGEENE